MLLVSFTFVRIETSKGIYVIKLDRNRYSKTSTTIITSSGKYFVPDPLRINSHLRPMQQKGSPTAAAQSVTWRFELDVIRIALYIPVVD